ncbi:MAG: GntR family transcriptional regulator, partial [Leptothrix sp. (in: b-proteobacteria)]
MPSRILKPVANPPAAAPAVAAPMAVSPLVVTDGEHGTLGQAVYERIKADIFDFRMAPGQRYSEQELANQFGVSRTPLRFALHVLAREGYLDRVGGHAGWLVK